MKEQLVAPFPWFGGKRKVAAEVWRRFGNVANYVEPFFGSGAVLLGRPEPCNVETVNDADGLLANFWRALQADPIELTAWADWPVNEADLVARHLWLMGQRESLTKSLEVDPDFYDAKAAGWWLWGVCNWIGSGWCSGGGKWVLGENGVVAIGDGDDRVGVNKQLPHLGGGRGVNRKLRRQIPHMSSPQGINRKLPHMSAGRGINRKLPHLGNGAIADETEFDLRGGSWPGIYAMLSEIATRIRRVRVACGDWSRVTGDSVTWRHGLTGVFLDPPYPDGSIDYAVGDRTVAGDVRAWAVEAGKRPDMRIALCGYDEHDDLASAGWSKFRWKAHGGYGSQDGENANAERETIWFSPACIPEEGDMPLFAGIA